MAENMKASTIIDANGNTVEVVDAEAREALEKRISVEPQQFTDAEKTIARQNLGLVDNTKIEYTPIGDKCKQFASLMLNTDKVEAFIFFTDPHLAGLSPSEDEMHRYLGVLKTYYDATPTSFVVCGGDWLDDDQTQQEACFKLGYTDAWMRSNFDYYYPVVGNHDDNSYGVDESGEKYSGTFSMETVRNLMARREGDLYYSFDGIQTKGYVLNTGGVEESDAVMNEYRWGQITWLAEKLKADDAENSALFMHAGFRRLGAGASERTLALMASNITLLCQAYNASTSVTLNGVEYDFAGCTGCVRYILSGHMHNADGVEIHNGIPVISTYDMRMNGVPTFDLCLADYDKKTLYMVRVGSGSDRIIHMGEREYTEDMYNVTVNCPNSNNSNKASTIVAGGSYTTTISANIGYKLSSVSVTMGGTDITDTVYNNGVITITAVTGNVVITAETVKVFTNLADTSSSDWKEHSAWDDMNSVIVDVGQWTSEYGEPVVTNFIPIEKYDVLRFTGFERNQGTYGNPPAVVFFDENKNRVTRITLKESDVGKSNGFPTSVVTDDNGVTSYVILIRGDTDEQFIYNDYCNRVKYARFAALRTVPANEVIVTVNELIYPFVEDDTNLLANALDDNGVNVYNAPYGYMNGNILSGNGGTATNANTVDFVATGYITLPENGEAIYIKGADWDVAQNYCRFMCYDHFTTAPINTQYGTDGSVKIFTAVKLGEKYWKLEPLNGAWPEGKWYRISLYGNIDASAGKKLIITHGEPIE